jgi:hypothetical protein
LQWLARRRAWYLSLLAVLSLFPFLDLPLCAANLLPIKNFLVLRFYHILLD